ncbi:MAG: ribose-phosphate pyrophosphokinase [Proteobacteria bacterium]|nr:ribose-phosphate pyrophosphokinase [Pseudomonadota bacterium]
MSDAAIFYRNGKPLPVIMAGQSSRILGERIAAHLGTRFVALSSKRFDDGEVKIALEQNIRDFDTVVVASAAGNPNEAEKETRLLLRAARRRGDARSVTLLIPYMWYGRSDDTFGERAEPALMDTIETLRPFCDRVLIVDPHNPNMTREKFADAANIRTSAVVHLAYPYAVQLADMIERGMISRDALMLAHADAGSKKRISPEFRACVYNTLALKDRNANEDDWAIGLKDRDKVTGKSRYVGFSTDVKGRDVVIFEDMIASGGTAIELAEMLKSMGARSVVLFATSGLFTSKADQAIDNAITKINQSKLDAVFVTDTYDLSQAKPAVHKAILASPVIHIINTSKYLAGVVHALHSSANDQDIDANSVSAVLRGAHSSQKLLGQVTAYKPGFPLQRLVAAA